MSDRILLGTLSEDGWISSPIKTADYLLSYFLVSEYSRSYIFYGRISSFPYILQNTQGNMTQAVNDTRTTLANLFARYFSNVEVEVSSDADTNSSSKVQLTVYVAFTDDAGKKYRLGQLLDIVDMKVNKIIQLNNFGS